MVHSVFGNALLTSHVVAVHDQLLVAVLHALSVHTRTSYHATVLHPLSLATAFQVSVGVVSLVGDVVAFNVGFPGHALSTCTPKLGHVATFPLLLVSFTAPAFNVNPVVPFTLTFHV